MEENATFWWYIGLLLMVVVHTADIQDRDGAKLVLEQVKETFPQLQIIWADAGYSGKLVDWVKVMCGWVLETVKRSDDVKGFKVLPHMSGGTYIWMAGSISTFE